MAFLTDQEKQKIRAAIAEAEARTSGEIVTVIADSSDTYLYIPTLWAALLALAVPGLNFLFGTPMDQVLTYQIQVLTFLAAALLFQLGPVKMHLIPKRVKHYRASLVARQQFVYQGLHTTENRTGILIFVSVAEHYVEIIADKGINDRIENNVWQASVDEFVSLVREGRTYEGFMTAVNHCREQLWTHFPAEGRNPNELPDHLVEI
ncbi:MAG: TPM domain-containing protein [Gammaproteobacteria bacterium]|nr:TPM domain-containing protein [Gammaproteobacteria bacterium]